MKIEPIPSFSLDIKQDFPQELRLTRERCKSLQHTNDVLIATLLIVGIGLSAFYIYRVTAERKAQKEQE